MPSTSESACTLLNSSLVRGTAIEISMAAASTAFVAMVAVASASMTASIATTSVLVTPCSVSSSSQEQLLFVRASSAADIDSKVAAYHCRVSDDGNQEDTIPMPSVNLSSKLIVMLIDQEDALSMSSVKFPFKLIVMSTIQMPSVYFQSKFIVECSSARKLPDKNTINKSI